MNGKAGRTNRVLAGGVEHLDRAIPDPRHGTWVANRQVVAPQGFSRGASLTRTSRVKRTAPKSPTGCGVLAVRPQGRAVF